jgi:NAD(P)-dependent dehydrogenase (short-subunit alcohol dehydrogenase family)
MVMNNTGQTSTGRRNVLIGAGSLAAAGIAAAASAQVPSNARNAGPIAAGRDTQLAGKVAFVTGAARGIGRAIAVELAANGADVAIFDIAGPVSPASNAKPATPDDLAETVRQVEAHGRRCLPIKGDIRKIAQLRSAHDQVLKQFGRIDVVVADAAIQRWKDLLEMEDSDWNDVIDNNVNGTANTVRAFAPTLCGQKSGRFILLSSMQGKHGTAGASYLFGLQARHYRVDEVGRRRVRQTRRDGKLHPSRPRRHRTDPLPCPLEPRDRRNGGEPAKEPDRSRDMEQPCTSRAVASGLA